MKKILAVILITYFHFSFSQSHERKYIMFDSSSNSTYEYEIGNGKKELRRVFIKENKKDGNITFHIKDKMFTYSYKSNEIDTCSIKYLKNIKFSNLKSLEEKVNKVNPLYPHKVFPNLYLVEKIGDSIILKYKVKWEYYIE